MSGSSSFQSSQNTSKSEKVKSGAVSLMSTPEDQVTYRKYRIHKTQGVLKQCTNQKISFRERYVELSKRFLTDPASMPLDEIEVLILSVHKLYKGRCLLQKNLITLTQMKSQTLLCNLFCLVKNRNITRVLILNL